MVRFYIEHIPAFARGDYSCHKALRPDGRGKGGVSNCTEGNTSINRPAGATYRG